jgi:hypothetical protein
LTIIGSGKLLPATAQKVCCRSQLMVAFNELKEARELRRKLVERQAKEPGEKGDVRKIDLVPDYQALSDCLDKIEKKLRL